MKILLIHNRNIFEQDGASANRWRTMVEGLSKDGFNINMIFTQGYGTVSEFKKYGWEGEIGAISYSYSIFLLRNSLWMKRISAYILAPLLKKLNAFIVRKKVEKFNPQIIWLYPSIEVLDTYLDVIEKLQLKNYKLMVEINEFPDIGLVHSTNSLQLKISKRYCKILLTKIIPKVNLLLIMTKHLLEYYKQYSDAVKASFLHLPMTVDMKRFDIERKPTDRYIAYCGSSSFLKDGVDILIHSFSLIVGKYPGLKLKIAAFMEADGGKMLALINQIGLQHAIEYVGELRRDEIPDFIMNAEVLLLPRPDSKQAQGGFPTKLGEYLSTGNPVCATSVGEIPDYLTDNETVFFAEPGDINSFADAMDRALSNPVNAATIGQNGKRVAALNFDMEVQAKRLAAFLKMQEQ